MEVVGWFGEWLEVMIKCVGGGDIEVRTIVGASKLSPRNPGGPVDGRDRIRIQPIVGLWGWVGLRQML